MRVENLCPSITSIPTCATISRRSQTVFVASPLSSYQASTSSVSSTSAVPVLSYQGPADCIKLSRDERNLAVTYNCLIKLLDLSSGREIRNLPAHSLPIKSLCSRRNSIYSWISGSLDCSWAMWDTRCHPANVLGGRVSGPIRCLDISPDDSLLAVGTDSALQLYDIRNRGPLKTFPISTTGLCFHPSQVLLASYGLDRMVRFVCLDQMECVSVSDALPNVIRGISFSATDDYILAATDTELRLFTWEPCDPIASQTLPDQYSVIEVSLASDSVDLIAYGVDSSLNLLNYSIEEILLPSASSSSDEKLSEFTVSDTMSSSSCSSAPISPSEEFPVAAKQTGRISLPTRPSCRSLSHSEEENNRKEKRTQSVTRSKQVSSSNMDLRTRPRSPSENMAYARPNKLSTSTSRPNLLDKLPPKGRSLSTRTNIREKCPTLPPISKEIRKPQNPLEELMSKMSRSHVQFSRRHEKRGTEFDRSQKVLMRGDVCGLNLEVFGNDDPIVAITFLQTLNTERAWDVAIIHKYLPKLKIMLSNAKTVNVAIESLDFICSEYLDRLSSFANSYSSFGVDVASEQRKERAEKCLKELKELCDNRERYYKGLGEEETYRLDSLMSYLKSL